MQECWSLVVYEVPRATSIHSRLRLRILAAAPRARLAFVKVRERYATRFGNSRLDSVLEFLPKAEAFTTSWCSTGGK